MINYILREFLDIFEVVYFDDILIFSKTLEGYKEHVYKVLKALYDTNLRINARKSSFHSQKVEFLGFIIQPGKIEINPKKVESIRYWPEPTDIKGIKGFLRFTNFYRRFIEGFGGIATPFIKLIKRDKIF